MKKFKRVHAVVMFTALIVMFTIYSTNMNGDDIPYLEEATMTTEFIQTATVPCKDTENYGTGGLRNRICAHGTEAFCDWEEYHEPASNGTCTLSSPSEN